MVLKLSPSSVSLSSYLRLRLPVTVLVCWNRRSIASGTGDLAGWDCVLPVEGEVCRCCDAGDSRGSFSFDAGGRSRFMAIDEKMGVADDRRHEIYMERDPRGFSFVRCEHVSVLVAFVFKKTK